MLINYVKLLKEIITKNAKSKKLKIKLVTNPIKFLRKMWSTFIICYNSKLEGDDERIEVIFWKFLIKNLC